MKTRHVKTVFFWLYFVPWQSNPVNKSGPNTCGTIVAHLKWYLHRQPRRLKCDQTWHTEETCSFSQYYKLHIETSEMQPEKNEVIGKIKAQYYKRMQPAPATHPTADSGCVTSCESSPRGHCKGQTWPTFTLWDEGMQFFSLTSQPWRVF